MSLIEIEQLDATNLKVNCEKGYAKELNDFFTFKVPNYQYTPAYKNKIWDGQIRLFNLFTRTLYCGLLDQLEKFCDDRGYSYTVNPKKQNEIGWDDIHEYLNNMKLSNGKDEISLHDHQKSAIVDALFNKRCLLLSPTGSGKSLIIYCLVRYFLDNLPDGKILIITPTTGLVTQLESDFMEYASLDDSFSNSDIHKIFSGQDKQTSKRVVISTWQSLYKLPESYFEDFSVVLGDECHLYKAKSLTTLLSKLKNAYYRFGTTGTLDDSKTHKLVIEGLFGPTIKVVSTKELIDKNILANLKINCMVLGYDDECKKEVKRVKYQEEIDWIVGNKNRNQFISDLSQKLKGNTLVLFNFVEKHGKKLYDIAKDGDKEVYFIHGKTEVEDRESIRKYLDSKDDCILIASYGTCSTGINIRNIHNIIFASPSKSIIRVLQSIGRGLRISDSKDRAVVYDISDDLCWGKYVNHTLKHLHERIKIYTNEKFNFELFKIRIKEKL